MAPMKPLLGQVKELFGKALRVAFPSVPTEAIVMKTGNPKFGDYQCNNVPVLFKEHGAGLGFASPAAMGEAIRNGLPQNDVIDSVTVAPQGFVTVKLSQEWLTKQVGNIVCTESLECSDPPCKRVVVDFSAPNIAKDMHVGHLRSTILGESTCRILEFCGHEVHRLNHVGDWGTQFGMLIEYMREEYPNFMQELPEINDLQDFYRASKKRFDDDADFKRRAQLAVVDLQSGGEFARAAWQKICDVSRLAFQRIYSRLGVTLLERGESFYNSLIPPLVEELKDRGLCQDSKGAVCFFTPKVADYPLMAVKSDGGFGYDSTDLAAIYHRLFVMRSDWIVYITDLGQEQHFYMIFDAAEQAGWHRPPATRVDHMGFGVVQGEDKKKFKTRSGDTVKLNDLLDEAEERALQEIQARVAEQERKRAADPNSAEVFLATEEEQREAAQRLGMAAVRYFDMKQNRTSNYVFSYDRMLDAKGNSAVFLFYAYARIRSIQRNAEKQGVVLSKLDVQELKIGHPSERNLCLKLLRFPDVIEAILAELHLHLLTDYLWELCNDMTAFYRDCEVLGRAGRPPPAERGSRLLLCEATRKVLHKSFFLLGFTPLEKI